MTDISEGSGALTQGILNAGQELLAQAQPVTFVAYTRYVLPADGFVFWVRGSPIEVLGVLHYATDLTQSEDESIAVNQVIFTAKEEVQAFNLITPDQLYIAEISGGTDALGQYQATANSSGPPIIRFAFSRRSPFIGVAGVYHYTGQALLPPFELQLLESSASLSADTLLVSNSLPIWLTLPSYSPVWLPYPNPGIPLFPSFAVPQNIAPPYGAVHIEPTAIEGLQAGPIVVPNPLSQPNGQTYAQLCADQVRVTLYGATNDQALGFIDLVGQYTLDTENMGLMNIPVVRDEKRTQVELGVLAQKKTIDFRVNYYQGQMANVAIALIKKASLTVSLGQPS